MTVAHLHQRDSAELAGDRQAVLREFLDRALGPHSHRATITPEELGDLMGWGRSTAYAAVKRGVVPSVSVGRRVVIPVPGLVSVLLGIAE